MTTKWFGVLGEGNFSFTNNKKGRMFFSWFVFMIAALPNMKVLS